MKSTSRLITLHAITFLHPGTGQTTGVVDLPVQREVHTGFPMIASSGLKGSLRDKAERCWGKKSAEVTVVFGSEDARTAGALAVTDARILAFPVRSLQQVFVWVTCPLVISRLLRDLDLGRINVKDAPNPKRLTVGNEAAWTVPQTSGGGTFEPPLILEELAFNASENDESGKVANMIAALNSTDLEAEIRRRLVLVSDDDFQYLIRHGTQVSARIALNDQKTTTGSGGNLWYEETLPPETLLYALAIADDPRNGASAQIKDKLDVIQKLDDLFAVRPQDGQQPVAPSGESGEKPSRYLQVGGNETVGQGWCIVMLKGGTP